MDTVDIEAKGYEPCEDDEGWIRCVYCKQKVYAGSGEKLADLVRHEERCEWR